MRLPTGMRNSGNVLHLTLSSQDSLSRRVTWLEKAMHYRQERAPEYRELMVGGSEK